MEAEGRYGEALEQAQKALQIRERLEELAFGVFAEAGGAVAGAGERVRDGWRNISP